MTCCVAALTPARTAARPTELVSSGHRESAFFADRCHKGFTLATPLAWWTWKLLDPRSADIGLPCRYERALLDRARGSYNYLLERDVLE